MKVVTDKADRFGKYPLRVTGMKNLNELHQYLHQNYLGHKFVIILDETHEEYEDLEKEIYI